MPIVNNVFTPDESDFADMPADDPATDFFAVPPLPAGAEVVFKSTYGHSYFGSGCAWGKVTLENAELFGTVDNGFVSGPKGARVIDPTQPASVVARGGDAIGREGRRWSETYAWNVGAQAWERVRPA